MKGFLQVVSLFGLPLAVLIWYDLYAHTEGYQLMFHFKLSRPLAIGIHLATTFLCLHTPLRIWRRFDATSLRFLCLTAALAPFWAFYRLASSGRLDNLPLMKTEALFLIPVIVYPLISYLLFKWSRNELVTGPEEKDEGESEAPSEPNKQSDHEHGDS